MKIPLIESGPKATLKSLLAGGLLVGAQNWAASPRACRVPGWSMRAVVDSAQGAPLGRM